MECAAGCQREIHSRAGSLEIGAGAIDLVFGTGDDGLGVGVQIGEVDAVEMTIFEDLADLIAAEADDGRHASAGGFGHERAALLNEAQSSFKIECAGGE